MRAAIATAAAISCRVIWAPAATAVGGARTGKDLGNNSGVWNAGLDCFLLRLPICTAGRGGECLRHARRNQTADNNDSEEDGPKHHLHQQQKVIQTLTPLAGA